MAVVKRALAIAVAGAALYLVLPKLIAVLGAWPRLSTLNPGWFAVCLAAELVSFTCNFALQRLALRTKGWFPVVTAGLAGNAVTTSLPGGSAAGAAVQFHMLTTAGFDTDTAVGGLSAFSLLEVGGLLALPIFALPAILAGVPVSHGLVHTALLGIAAFVLYAIFGVIVLHTDWPLATLGRAAQSLWNRITRGRRPVTGLDTRLLAERDTIRAVLGKNWRQAAILTAGRLGFDYSCLLAALRATGASPQPSLVLLAYAAAGIVALFPVTPGGLGIVEASLSGLLILAGVRAGYAVLAVHRQEVHQGHPQAPQQRERHAEDQQRHEHHDPGDERGQQVAGHVPGDLAADVGRYPGDRGLAARGQLAQRPAPHLRALQQQEQDQDEERGQLDDDRDRALADGQRRPGQRLGVAGQPGRVPLHPALHVVPGHEVADPAPAVLRAGDVAGHPVRQVADPVRQRHPERED
jgi:uncharacterized membrane protein YbhN (UPF0104 family)